MPFVKYSREFIIDFNNRFPLDKQWREKHGVALFSEEHLRTSQIAIYYEWLEENIYAEFLEKVKDRQEKDKQVKMGIFIKPPVDSKEDIEKGFDLLRKIDFSTIKF